MPSIKLAARGTGDVRRLEYTKQMPDKQACHNPILLTNVGIALYLVKTRVCSRRIFFESNCFVE